MLLVIIAGMLDDALAHFEGQIQAGKLCIALLKLLHNVQSMKVVVKTLIMLLHGDIQNALAGVAKRWMTNVMHQGQGLNQIFVQPQFGSDGARYL